MKYKEKLLHQNNIKTIPCLKSEVNLISLQKDITQGAELLIKSIKDIL